MSRTVDVGYRGVCVQVLAHSVADGATVRVARLDTGYVVGELVPSGREQIKPAVSVELFVRPSRARQAASKELDHAAGYIGVRWCRRLWPHADGTGSRAPFKQRTPVISSPWLRHGLPISRGTA